MLQGSCPRDMIGYGLTPPDSFWPGGARLAVNFVVNCEVGGYLHHADSHADDLPSREQIGDLGNPVMPCKFDVKDTNSGGYRGFNSGNLLFARLKDSFGWLYRERERTPRMMPAGPHCRDAALERFLNHVRQHDKVRAHRRADIAWHWREQFVTGNKPERKTETSA